MAKKKKRMPPSVGWMLWQIFDMIDAHLLIGHYANDVLDMWERGALPHLPQDVHEAFIEMARLSNSVHPIASRLASRAERTKARTPEREFSRAYFKISLPDVKKLYGAAEKIYRISNSLPFYDDFGVGRRFPRYVRKAINETYAGADFLHWMWPHIVEHGQKSWIQYGRRRRR